MASAIPDSVWAPAAVDTTVEGGIPEADWGGAPETPGDGTFAAQNFPQGDPAVGVYPWTGTQQIELWNNATADIDLSTGNLLLSVTDFEAMAPGVAPRLTRYYNSLSERTSAALGNWTLGVGPDVGVIADSSPGFTSNTFFAPNGHTVDFPWEEGAFGASSPAGMNIMPTAGQAGEIASLEWNQSGATMIFSAHDGPRGEGWLVSELDRNGVGTTYTYLANGAGFEMTDAVGRVHTFTYATTSGATFTTSDNRSWEYSLTSERLTYAGNRVIEGGGAIEYNANGQLTFMSSPTTVSISNETFVRAIAVTYDASGRVATLTQGTGDTSVGFAPHTTTTFTYGAGAASVENALGNDTTYKLGTAGKITATTNPLGNTNATVWNAQNAVTSTSNAAQGSTGGTNLATLDYDSLGNATSYILPTGAAARAVYAQGVDCPNAGSGNPYSPHCTISAEGNTTEYTYDNSGNRLSERTGGITHSWAYESDGSVCGGVAGQICSATDGKGNTTTYAYGTHGNLTTVTPPAPLSPTTYTYDLASRVTSVTAGGIVTNYYYDRFDHIVFTRFGTGTTADTVTYDTDAAGTLHGTYWDQDVTRSEQYEHNPLGLETSRITQQSGIQVASSSATYDVVGNMTSYTTANGTVTATYDAANQLIALAEPGSTCQGAAPGATGCVRFEYDADGNETRRLFPGGATQKNFYDASGRLASFSAESAGERNYSIHYSYRAADGTDSALLQHQIVNRHIDEQPDPPTDTRSPGVGPTVPTPLTSQFTTTYTYDASARLTHALEGQYPGDGAADITTAEWTYAYDANGNVTSQTRQGANPGGAVGTTTFAYNAANQIISSSADTGAWDYDANGQMTDNGITGVDMAYGQRDQVTSIGQTSYTSFGQGNTITTADSSGDAFNIGALGVMQRTAPHTATSYLRTTTGGLVGFDNTVSSYYYSTDIRGSIVGIYDEAGEWQGGYSYSPYGEERSVGSNPVVVANQYRYIGGEKEGDLYRLGARYYDPSLGQFMQMDPSGQEANPYLYAAGDPINASDPTGLMTFYRALVILETVLFGGDIYAVLGGAGSTAEGLGATFSLACGLVAGSLAAPTVAGLIVATGGCLILGILVQNALEQEGSG